MARVELEALAHSYLAHPSREEDYALKPLTMEWRDGAAYALLGPSGCGKTTLLNIISGLVSPTCGRVLFDGEDATAIPTGRRNIAQVFQFPVIYDTMTVYDNLAFPLRNRKVPPNKIDARVRTVAERLGLADSLAQKARGLAADAKQKISLGRGLVRDDVRAILFDEPLTVIDPQLKWRLRSALKSLHREFDFTMIYVTHDQTEALTFADQVAVMNEGRIVQIGTPKELFEHPRDAFVGHFIGSPGMNLLNCKLDGDNAIVGARAFRLSRRPANPPANAALHLGIRPEFIRLLKSGEESREGEMPIKILGVEDGGHRKIVRASLDDMPLNIAADDGCDARPGDFARAVFNSDYAHLYADGKMLGEFGVQ